MAVSWAEKYFSRLYRYFVPPAQQRSNVKCGDTAVKRGLKLYSYRKETGRLIDNRITSGARKTKAAATVHEGFDSSEVARDLHHLSPWSEVHRKRCCEAPQEPLSSLYIACNACNTVSLLHQASIHNRCQRQRRAIAKGELA